MDEWNPPELQQLTTQSSVEADERIKHRLHEDLVYRDDPQLPATNQIHQLASARGLKAYEFGPKSLEELKNEQIRLQKWGAKFAGANQVLKNEVEALKVELQKAYAQDPLRTGHHVTKAAYDLLMKDYNTIKIEYNKLKNEKGLSADHLNKLRLARDAADEQRNESLQQAASAADTVTKLKSQLLDAQRIAMQKQGAVQDLDHRLGEMQSRYDILAHHVLQLGEEKTSLLEALRERQSQLDFCLAQLQLLDRDAKSQEYWKQRCKDLEAELNALKGGAEGENRRLLDEIDRLKKLLQDCADARRDLEMKLGLPNSVNITSDGRAPPGGRNTVKTRGGMREEEPTKKMERQYKEGTEFIKSTKEAELTDKKSTDDVVRHRGLVVRVRWHPTSGKHTFGTRHLHIDSTKEMFGWSKGADDPVSKIIRFNEIKKVAYGYASHMTEYKRRFDCPQGVRTPSSGSGAEDQLTSPPIGPPKGLLASWPKISLTTCFSIVTKDGKIFDFFTATDSEAFDWIMRLSRVLKKHDIQGLHDRVSFLAARGWTRLIEQCCERQITCRRLLIEGLEKAGVFAASTGLGTGKGTRKARVSATKTGGQNAKVFKGGAGLVYKGTSTPTVPNDRSWMKNYPGKSASKETTEAKGFGVASKLDLSKVTSSPPNVGTPPVAKVPASPAP